MPCGRGRGRYGRLLYCFWRQSIGLGGYDLIWRIVLASLVSADGAPLIHARAHTRTVNTQASLLLLLFRVAASIVLQNPGLGLEAKRFCWSTSPILRTHMYQVIYGERLIKEEHYRLFYRIIYIYIEPWSLPLFPLIPKTIPPEL